MNHRRLWRTLCYLVLAAMILTGAASCQPKDPVESNASISTGSETAPSVSRDDDDKTAPSDPSPSNEPEETTTNDGTDPSESDESETTAPSEPSLTSPGLETTAPSETEGPDPAPVPTSPELPPQPEKTLSEIFEMIAPSVVSVRVTIPKTGVYEQREELFSGLMVEPVGIFVTTYSLLSPALDYRGNLLDGASVSVSVPGHEKAYLASLIGVHTVADLALFRLENTEGILFETATLAKAPAVKVGSPVYSVGYPSELIAAGGLSTGHVTSVFKTTYQEYGMPLGLLETDIAIQPYYAGGPLLDAYGEVIGVMSGYRKRVYYLNRGYAVPSPVVADVMTEIKARVERLDQDVERASFGIVVMGDEDYRAMREQKDYPEGLYITFVTSESTAYTAGLSEGDILLRLNDEAMTSLTDLVQFMEKQIIGSRVTIQAYRPSEARTITLSCFLREE